MMLDAVLAGMRLVHDGMLMLCFGSSAFLALMLPVGLRPQIHARMAPLLRCAVWLAVLTSAVSLPLQTAQIVGSWGAALDYHVLQALLHTGVGRVWMLQMLLACLMLMVLWWRAPAQAGALMCVSGLLLASLALSGHAAMDEGVRASLHLANHVLHLWCAGLWLGALWPFLLCLPLLNDGATQKEAISALRRFSSAGHVAVAGVLLSGLLNTRLVLGQWLPGLSSPYQIMLAGKLLLVLAMVAVAVFNRYVSVPAMKQQRASAIAAIRRGCLVEIVLGAAVIALVAVFGMLDPV